MHAHHNLAQAQQVSRKGKESTDPFRGTVTPRLTHTNSVEVD